MPRSLPPAPEAVLVTGADGPLAQAIARRLSATRIPLVLAAPHLGAARRAKEDVDRLHDLLGTSAPAIAIAADPASAEGASTALAAAREAAGPFAFVVVCAPLRVPRSADGDASVDDSPFRPMLEALAALPEEALPCGIVLAAHALPPLDDHDARHALDALARGAADRLDGTPVHVVTIADPHAAAAARAFGLMDRPFGNDVEQATRRLEEAADAVCAFVLGYPCAS